MAAPVTSMAYVSAPQAFDCGDSVYIQRGFESLVPEGWFFKTTWRVLESNLDNTIVSANGYLAEFPTIALQYGIDHQTKEVEVQQEVVGFQEVDMVNHPPHYTNDPSGVECIQITRHRSFNIGNAFKYMWRAGRKMGVDGSDRTKEIEDLKKAIWYINDEIALLEGRS